MSLTPDAGTTGSRSSRRDFPTNRGGLCQKGWTSGALLARAGPADHARSCRRRAASSSRRPGTRRSTSSPAARRIRAEHGPDAVAVFGGGGLTNEKAYQLGKFARVALRHRAHRLQRPVLHGVGRRGGATGASGSTAGCRSRSTDLGRRTGRAAPRAATSPRRCRPSVHAPVRAARRRRAGRRRPPPDAATAGAHRRRAGPAPAAAARHRPRAAARPAAPRRHRGLGRRGVPRRAHRRLGRGAPLGGRRGGPSGSSR